MRTKQVIIVRKDLKMRMGKAVAQGAHASLAILTNNLIGYPFHWYKFPLMLVRFLYLFIFHKPFRVWHTGSFKKICVYVNSKEELLAIYADARNTGLLCSLIKDKGLTEFKGKPTYTTVAIGTDLDYKIYEITGDLPLL